jgi:signal peptidase II
MLGHVVDFLDFYIGTYHWPAFNVADSAIFLGAMLLILQSFLQGEASSGEPQKK